MYTHFRKTFFILQCLRFTDYDAGADDGDDDDDHDDPI